MPLYVKFSLNLDYQFDPKTEASRALGGKIFSQIKGILQGNKKGRKSSSRLPNCDPNAKSCQLPNYDPNANSCKDVPEVCHLHLFINY